MFITIKEKDFVKFDKKYDDLCNKYKFTLIHRQEIVFLDDIVIVATFENKNIAENPFYSFLIKPTYEDNSDFSRSMTNNPMKAIFAIDNCGNETTISYNLDDIYNYKFLEERKREIIEENNELVSIIKEIAYN